MPWMIERLLDDVADAHARVQRGVRILEDDLHVAARLRACAPARTPSTSSPLNRTSPDVGSISRRMQRPVVRLAAAGFADEPERFPSSIVKLTSSTARTDRRRRERARACA